MHKEKDKKQRKEYEKPKVTVTPLEIEERLMKVCGKNRKKCPDTSKS